MSDNKDIPDIPPEVLARKALPLTAETATLLKEDKFMREDGTVVDRRVVTKGPSKEAVAAGERAERYAGPEPLRGISTEQVRAIRDLDLPGLPKMDPTTGDRGEEYRNALWAKYPWYAAIRYAYRINTWPTKLPAQWPPLRPKEWLSVVVVSGPAEDPALAMQQHQQLKTVLRDAKPKRPSRAKKAPAPSTP